MQSFLVHSFVPWEASMITMPVIVPLVITQLVIRQLKPESHDWSYPSISQTESWAFLQIHRQGNRHAIYFQQVEDNSLARFFTIMYKSISHPTHAVSSSDTKQ